MKLTLSLILVAVITVSCAPKKIRKTKNVYKSTSVGVPYALRHSKKVCGTEGLFAQMPGTYVQSVGKKSYVKLKDYNYSEVFDNVALGSRYSFPAGWSNTIELEECFIHSETYEDDTYQDAAISILVPIREFLDKYSDILYDLDLSPVSLSVAPLIEQAGGHIINNAYYSRILSQIVFLPQGKVKDDDVPFGGVPLWKFPMVSLHEYGHHLFSEIVYTNNKDSDDKLLCFDNKKIGHISHFKTDNSEKRKTDKMTAFTALNEGFADLLAYYGYEPGRKLINMGCMTHSRDVEVAKFLNGEDKKLTTENLASFLAPYEIEYGFCDEEINYQDVHIIGAIYARAWYDILKALKTTDKKSIEVLVDWLKALKETNMTTSSARRALEESVDEMINTVAKHYPNTKLKECVVYKKYFPVFIPDKCSI